MSYEIWNRRYTGSKFKLADWIYDLILQECKGNSFCDIFAGTAIMSKKMLNYMDRVHINDFLFSNEIIYKAFFEQVDFDNTKLDNYKAIFSRLNSGDLSDNYVSTNFGGKYFSYNDSLKIGYIREIIENANDLNEKEKDILSNRSAR